MPMPTPKLAPTSTPIISKTFSGAFSDAAPSVLGDDEVWHVLTTEDVDRSREVVVASGLDWSHYLSNAVVTYDHSDERADSELLPVGRAREVRLSADGRKVLARTQFDFEDEFARRVGGQCKRGFLNSWSIRFRPIESGPPTREEIARNPSWKNAKCIYRRAELVSYSPVVLPDNPYALTIKKALHMSEIAHDTGTGTEPGIVSKGADAGDGKPMPRDEAATEQAETAPFEPGAHVKMDKAMGGGCGVVKHLHHKGSHLAADGKTRMDASHDEPVYEVEHHNDDHEVTGESKRYRAAHLKEFEGGEGEGGGDGDAEAKGADTAGGVSKAMTEGVGAAGGFAVGTGKDEEESKAHATDGDGDDDTEDARLPRAGHFVKFDTGSCRGVGKLVSLHRGEMVPDAEDDVMGTEGDPGAKVQVYKAMGDGHKPTEHHVACRMSQLGKCEAPLKAPTKAKGAPAATEAVSKAAPAPAPAPAAPARTFKFHSLSADEVAARDRARTAAYLDSPDGRALVAKALAEKFSRRRGAI